MQPFVKYFLDILDSEGNDWENDGINIKPRDNTDSAISIFRAKLSRRQSPGMTLLARKFSLGKSTESRKSHPVTRATN